MVISETNNDQGSKLLAHRAAQVQGGAARAAVLGVNDGLVSTVCLVLGVAAATGGAQDPVLLAGFAGLVAGAVSMAAGEWISVQAQVDLFEGILHDLKDLAKNDMKLLTTTLESTLVKNGLGEPVAKSAVLDLTTNKKDFTEVYALQVLGVNPDELGAPWVAALSSFGLFTVGSLAALGPWFFAGGNVAVLSSVTLTALLSLGVGAYIANSSGKSIWYGALRQFLIVLFASSVTYGVGLLFGIVVG